MDAPSVLGLAGLYRAKLSAEASEMNPVADFRVVQELHSKSLGASKSIIMEEESLATVLKTFCGSFMLEEKRTLKAVEKQEKIHEQFSSALGRDTALLTGVTFNKKTYPLTVTGGGTALHQMVSCPLSSHGVFVQIPTHHYISFCQSCLKESDGLVECPRMGVCPFADAVYFDSKSIDEVSFRRAPSHLFGYGMILNSEVFMEPCKKEEPTEHIVVCILSLLPEFSFCREVALNVAALLHTTAVESHFKANQRTLDALLSDVWTSALGDLLVANSESSVTFPGMKLPLPLLNSKTFSDLRRSRAMLYRMIDTPVSTLFLSFNYDAIRVLHSLLITESRIIFIGCTPQHCSACAVSAPSLVAPLKWVAPLIPFFQVRTSSTSKLMDAIFLPSMGKEKLKERENSDDSVRIYPLESQGFIIGCTSEILPELILRWSSISQETSPTHQIWIADARTGNVVPLGLDIFSQSSSCDVITPSFPVALVPVSDKLQKGFSGAVKEGQRQSFRSLISFFSQMKSSLITLEKDCEFLENLLQNKMSIPASSNSPDEEFTWEGVCKSLACHCPHLPDAAIVDAHAAFLEFNTHRICGEYRKGVTKLLISGKEIVQLNASSFLQPQLCCDELVEAIQKSHMFQQFVRALVLFEVFGLRGVLNGSPKEMLQRSSPLPLHPWILSHSMMADLCLFYSRARNRFTSAFPELSGVVLSQWCIDRVSSLLVPIETDESRNALRQTRFASVLSSVVSLAGTASDGSTESKGSVLKMFSKASKAMKKLQNGERQYIFSSPYAQSFSSFRFSSSENEMNDNAGSAPSPTSLEYTLPEIISEVPSKLNLVVARSSLPPCRRLPLDMIHHFSAYHSLIDPQECNCYTSFSTANDKYSGEVNYYKSFGTLCPSSQRIWDKISALNQATKSSSSKMGSTFRGEDKVQSDTLLEDSTAKASKSSETLLKNTELRPSLSDLFAAPQAPLEEISGFGGFSSGVPEGYEVEEKHQDPFNRV